MDNRESWTKFFIDLAKQTSLRSKDPFTKVGACVVSKDRRVLSLGYNGPCRAFPDDLLPTNRQTNIPLIKQKNTFMCHAELNTILNYRGSLADFKDATIYLTISPCHECAKALAQVGIKRVVYDAEYHREEMREASKYILSLCGVEYMNADVAEKLELEDK